MQLSLTVDLADKPPDALLTLVYTCADAGTRFTFTGTNKTIQATMEGGKSLTLDEYNAINAFDYNLKFIAPQAA